VEEGAGLKREREKDQERERKRERVRGGKSTHRQRLPLTQMLNTVHLALARRTSAFRLRARCAKDQTTRGTPSNSTKWQHGGELRMAP